MTVLSILLTIWLAMLAIELTWTLAERYEADRRQLEIAWQKRSVRGLSRRKRAVLWKAHWILSCERLWY